MHIDKHFTVSVYIVHQDKVLLHLHKKYNMILPLGGHIENNELPEEACIREAKEESGLHITLYNSENQVFLNLENEANGKVLINPMHTILCEINKEHYHIDLVYYATTNTFETLPEFGESKDLKWYTKESLKELKEVSPRVFSLACEALHILS